MRFLVACDSFKGSATSKQVGEALKEGILRAVPDVEVDVIPVADGGEGTVQALVDATKGEFITVPVTNPIGEKVEATFGILGDGRTAVIEMAAASGLTLIPPERRNPWITTTYGTGELIKAALERGCRRIIVGIGGSATNDAGAGMAQALGIGLLDENGNQIGFGGGELSKLHRIDMAGLDPRAKEAEFIVACDVDNPLTGEHGAAYVYAPQKGATPDMLPKLDANLRHFAEVVRQQLGVDVEHTPGAGAAGGLGAGLMAFLGAKLRCGTEIVFELVGLEERVMGADLIITGEGQIDTQTAFGKTPIGVAKLAKKYNKPVIAVAGTVGKGAEVVHAHGIDVVFSVINRPMTLKEAMDDVQNLLTNFGEQLGRLILTLESMFKGRAS
ncbi:MAG: glycerate kinase [Armatimonadota bacterium]|nr:glycerate kinase [Armatimonadota bacterium]MCX7776599.1 glycerate kinase [Armatimonadota bacterium]MDW8025258.1 glycerate kinase [Armatimonadota bacterium]